MIEKDSFPKAFAWMVCSMLSFSLMSLCIKLVSADLSQAILMWVRSWVFVIFAVSVLFLAKENPFRVGKAAPVLIFRGIMGFVGTACLFESIRHLPLPIALLLNWMSPLFVYLFSFFLGTGRPRLGAILSCGVAFVGVLLLVVPGSYDAEHVVSSISTFGLVVGISGAAAGGWAFLALRRASETMSAGVILFYFATVSLVGSTVLAAPELNQGAPALHPVPQLLAAIGIGILGTLGQWTMTQAYRFGPATWVSPLTLLGAGFGTVWGVLFLGETLSVWQFMGLVTAAIGILGVSLWAPSVPSTPHARR